ncbi:MAG: phosphopantothenate/pantothenate synthetase [Candidatus Heimdallarchaeota archaeon]|nr:phosphopantothenate/pantothenate synthetase [Candidatus Heimdallarchaeota archaeon]MCK4254432.1 phosphopantothenate/pantothenate synthetase [Candidatus Heimdallarchaeota archaeon]
MPIPDNHPRAESLRTREKIIEGMHEKVVAEAGLIAHGRGEAYDYLLGEKTPNYAQKQQEVAVAMLLTAKKAVISVNGNIAALCPKEIVQLAEITGASLEINLFYRSKERIKALTSVLEQAGATTILGVDPEYQKTIEEISHLRRIVDVRGIYSADVILVPLEDGDRTMALRRAGKKVITIDLNPLSRTSLWANVTIVNNVIRAIPEMIEETFKLKEKDSDELKELINDFDNYKSLQETLNFMSSRLKELAEGKLEDLTKNL